MRTEFDPDPLLLERRIGEAIIKSKDEKIAHLERCLGKRRRRASKIGERVREQRGIKLP